MVFIPKIWAKHFYIICFNLQLYKVDVFDYSAAEDNLSIEDKYFGVVGKMVTPLKTSYYITPLI
ncbi:hypothetical protein Hanom_Chr17g01568591 [Helianthus anomalus]